MFGKRVGGSFMVVLRNIAKEGFCNKALIVSKKSFDGLYHLGSLVFE